MDSMVIALAIPAIFYLALLSLGVYATILLIKALRIYIKKNS